jgi:hypothetical protein
MKLPICKYCGKPMVSDEEGFGFFECDNPHCIVDLPFGEF